MFKNLKCPSMTNLCPSMAHFDDNLNKLVVAEHSFYLVTKQLI